MKTLFRILIILVVTVLIGGLMYMGVNASSSAVSGFPEFEGGQRPEFSEGGQPGVPPGGEGFRPPEGERGERGEGGGLGGFPGGVVKAVVIISFAGFAYSAVAWTLKKVGKKASLPT